MLIDELTATPEDKRLYYRERAYLEATEAVHQALNETGVSKSELAARLGCTTGNVSKLLTDSHLRIGTLSDLLDALGYQFSIVISKQAQADGEE